MKLVLLLLLVVSSLTFMTCVVWRMVIYEREIFRVLGKHGRRAYWRFGTAQQRQLEEYRLICEEHGYPLAEYRTCLRCYRVAVGAWVASLVLMVALALLEG